MADPLPAVVRVWRTMWVIKRAASGPLDVTAADQVFGLIDGLFTVAERDATADGRGGLPADVTDRLLLEVFTADLDVLPNTVERFAVN